MLRYDVFPNFFLQMMEQCCTCLLKESAEHGLVNEGRHAALAPGMATACPAGLPFLAHSPGQELQPSLLQPTAVVLGCNVPGNQLSHPSSWIYAVALLHLCLCRQSALKERKEIQLMGVTGFDSLCAAGEILTQ